MTNYIYQTSVLQNLVRGLGFSQVKKKRKKKVEEIMWEHENWKL